ncbi:hypothetical protein E2C01_009355 [Portunus trituberculatus]|uniref:Uncharacterized protein n=1 Tax=Portunus trituberculatus TaxID=210409 RepID=A0A5B7D4B6_PORTR|nr:hypothetical protein [Portunus trituberculatus]
MDFWSIEISSRIFCSSLGLKLSAREVTKYITPYTSQKKESIGKAVGVCQRGEACDGTMFKYDASQSLCMGNKSRSNSPPMSCALVSVFSMVILAVVRLNAEILAKELSSQPPSIGRRTLCPIP